MSNFTIWTVNPIIRAVTPIIRAVNPISGKFYLLCYTTSNSVYLVVCIMWLNNSSSNFLFYLLNFNPDILYLYLKELSLFLVHHIRRIDQRRRIQIRIFLGVKNKSICVFERLVWESVDDGVHHAWKIMWAVEG